MRTQTIQALRGDVLDALIWNLFGACSDEMLAQVYTLNPGLAENGAIFAEDRTVIIPVTMATMSREDRGIKLWD